MHLTENSISIRASEHPIQSVKISKSFNAEIVRVFSLQLKSGRNTVEVTELPSETGEMWPSVSSGARIDDFLFTTEVKVVNTVLGADVPSRSIATPESVRLLLVEEASLRSQLAVKEQESQLLHKYMESLTAEHMQPGDIGRFLQSNVDYQNQIIEEATAINEQIVQIKRKIQAEQKRLDMKAGETRARAVVIISSDIEGKADLKLTYIVNKCHWRPTYELHATSEDGKPSPSITLQYLAQVSQSTGEDWTGAELTLSTMASDLSLKAIPRPLPLKVVPSAKASLFGPPVQNAFTKNTGGLFGQSNTSAVTFGQASVPQNQAQSSYFGFGATQPVQAQPQAASAQPSSFSLHAVQTHVGGGQPEQGHEHEGYEQTLEELSEPSSIVRETPLSMVFVVNGKSSIPSDGLNHRVTLAVLPLKARISYVTIPRDDPTVFLQCSVTNTSDLRLLSGPMTIIFDNSYISTTTIGNEDINPGETFECRLGTDVSTKVTYTRSSKLVPSEVSAFAEETESTLFSTKITVHNKHAFDLADVIVRDRMPTCDDKRVKVILRKPSDLINVKEGSYASVGSDGTTVGWEKLVDQKGGQKEGRFEWKSRVKSGEKIEFLAEYEIKVPKGATFAVRPIGSLFG